MVQFSLEFLHVNSYLLEFHYLMTQIVLFLMIQPLAECISEMPEMDLMVPQEEQPYRRILLEETVDFPLLGPFSTKRA